MENTYKILEDLLLSNDEYKSEDNTILKAKVYEDAEKLNPYLIELLLDNDKLKEVFFIKVKDFLVFDKEKFITFVNSKNFLPDSYTRYCNKIGLTHNNKFISKSNDVVIDFPYKDCVLAGGQTKDDQKREEIVFNELIASDEITRMLAPKVFTSAKRYTKDGIEEDITFNEDDNLIIKGNNLIALSSILERYEGKVKCIYIDPPYNTGSDSFGYNDKFNHSTWLTFMKNRLEIAYKLLKEDGVILVQCNDNEQAYLKVLMDEIFKKENFELTLNIKVRHENRILRQDIRYQLVMEYIHIYSKNKEIYLPNRIFNENNDTNDYIYDIVIKNNPIKIEKIGKYDVEIYDNNSYELIRKENGNLKEYNIRGSLITQKGSASEYYEVYLKSRKVEDGLGTLYKVIDMGTKGDGLGYRYIRQPFDEKGNNGFYYQGKPIKNTLDKGNPYPNFYDFEVFFNNVGKENDIIFKNGKKPEVLIEKLFEILNIKENDLVLDFFVGSGTTCAVAHKMGRKYIGIEQMDYINDITVTRLEKVIQGEQGGISKSLNWQGGGSFVYCELKENAYSLIELVKSATEENIDKIKEQIFNDDRIVPYIRKEDLEKAIKEFEENSLDEKKEALITLIDKNKLYVNFSDIDDEDYKITESERKFTNSFYKGV